MHYCKLFWIWRFINGLIQFHAPHPLMAGLNFCMNICMHCPGLTRLMNICMHCPGLTRSDVRVGCMICSIRGPYVSNRLWHIKISKMFDFLSTFVVHLKVPYFADIFQIFSPPDLEIKCTLWTVTYCTVRGHFTYYS